MSSSYLTALGGRIAELRISRRLKQTELAYEAGVSHRTLQRLEAGESVNSEGLIRVIDCLGRLENVLAALDAARFSPYEMLADTGLKVSELKRQRGARPASRKRRVRRAADAEPGSSKVAAGSGKEVKVQWPEDQP